MMTLYQSWLARNEARDSKRIDDPEVIAKRSVHLLEEWRNVQSPKATRQPKPRDRWTPPAMGWIKINVDGAMAKNSEKGGGGVVVRDHDGRFLAGACHFSPSLQDPEDAELRACKSAIALIKNLKLTRVVLETDNVNVASKLTSEQKDRSMHGPLVEEIKKALRELDDHTVKWARRTTNMAAHTLAKEGCGLEVCNNWFLVHPDCIGHILAQDMAGN
jgi:ribonuclease HI